MSRTFLCFLCATFIALGCDQDPLGRSERPIAGSYNLNRWEGGLFYLDEGNSRPNGLGVVGGPVKRLGWNDQWIVAERTGTPGGDGWMVIDVAHKRVSGPVALQVLTQRPELASLVSYRADSAWDRLR